MVVSKDFLPTYSSRAVGNCLCISSKTVVDSNAAGEDVADDHVMSDLPFTNTEWGWQ